ncbi:outer membrane protein [Bradyrhizobium prioriisuperbiae]|uniref:outer membrane protein n=1 Tax=Bradyrhizobium prioriisuperbiae TaxID=2854389 RepID=UPI0028E207B2|nr:outer membrane beta-barrel protein [Bradyrhizobium prioritasuperba]
MRNLKYLLAATAASLLSTAALAADLPIAPPPAYAPPPPADFGGWYLRGDIGISNQSVKRLNNALDANLITQNQTLGFDSAGIYGLGVGYQINNWFRVDATGEYRASANFHGRDLNTFPVGGGPIGAGVDNYSASKSEWLFLANAYVDLGTWWCVTPFIGAGVGTSRVTISNFTDQGLASFGAGALPSSAFADSASKWNFAWAVHAGLAYKVTPGLTMELAYRYVDLGDGITGDIKAFDGTNNVVNPMTFKHITSQDVRLGVRWSLDPTPVYAPRPLITKG